jgi:hypothetical protein
MTVDLDQLLAREEIRDVMRRYARGVDRFDVDAVRSCYHPDATDERGPYSGDLDGFIAYLQSETGLPMFLCTMHLVTDQIIVVTDERAVSESLTFAYHRLPEEHYLLGIRYLDHFERREGEWRIARRKVAYDWSIRRPASAADDLPAHFPRGTRGPDDLVYVHLLARFFGNDLKPAGSDDSRESSDPGPSGA